MTAVPAVRLAPGSGLLARRGSALLYQPVRDDALLAAFTSCPAGQEQRAVAAVTVGGGFAVGAYACVTWGDTLHVTVFGDLAVRTDHPALAMFTGADSATWVERTLPAGTAVVVEVATVDGPSDPDTDLGAGIAHAGGFRLELGPVSTAVEHPTGVAPAKDAAEAAPGPAAEAAPADPTQAVPLATVPDHVTPDDPDATLPPLEAGEVLADTATSHPRGRSPRVAARLCASGHPNPPSAATCVLCRALLGTERGSIVHVVRPSLGRLRFDDGSVVELDGDLLIGRNPERDPQAAAGELRPVRVGGAKVSRGHVAVLLQEWDVLVADRGSTNGTYVVAYPGAQVAGVAPGRPQMLEPGAVVYFGTRSFTLLGRDDG